MADLIPIPSLPGSVEQPVIGSETEQQLRALLQKKFFENQAQQQAEIARNQAMMQAASEQAPQVDYSGAMELARQFSGDQNIGARYRAPTSNQDLIQKLGEGIRKTQNDMADAQTANLKTLLADKQAGKQQATQDRFLASQDNKFFTDMRRDAEKASSKVGDAVQNISNVEAAIKPDANGMVDAARLKMSLSNFARLMGEKGVLTDQDTGRQLAPTAALKLAEMEQYLTSNPGAVKIPAKVASAMNEALADAKNAVKGVAVNHLENIKETYGEPTAPTANMFYKKGGEKIVQKLEKRFDSMLGAAKPQAANAAQVLTPSEWLKQKKAGK